MHVAIGYRSKALMKRKQTETTVCKVMFFHSSVIWPSYFISRAITPPVLAAAAIKATSCSFLLSRSEEDGIVRDIGYDQVQRTTPACEMAAMAISPITPSLDIPSIEHPL
jgi:hypothetical protein